MGKTYSAIIAISAIIASQTAVADEALARAKGCMTCHSVDKKVVGPSYRDVAKRYSAKDVPALAAKISNGGKGSWGAVPMPPNKVTADEAERLAKWVLGIR